MNKKLISLILSFLIFASAFSVIAYAGEDDFNTDIIPFPTTTTTTTKPTTTKPTAKPTTKATTKQTTTAAKVGKVYLSSTSYVYNGKVKNPTIYVKDSKGNTISKSYYSVSVPSGRKNVGSYTYKITFKGKYSGSKSLSFTIKPVATSISSYSKGKKKFTVKWKKMVTQVSGYQIQHATNSSFKNCKTKTISKNSITSSTITTNKSKQRYYFRVRTYKTINGTKYYSAWSATKNTTTL